MSQNISSLSLATYNIHSCVGADGEYDPDRTVAVIGQLDADIIALQEVENSRHDTSDVLDFFGEQTQMRVIPGLTMFRDTSGFGNAVLARCPLESIDSLDISVDGREPRGAISLVVPAGNQKVHVMATHLGLRRAERLRQVQILVQKFREKSADLSVLMGDLNEWYYHARPLKALHRFFPRTATPPTFPTRFPLLKLDRILTSANSNLRSLITVKNARTRVASDHLPLKGELVIDSRGES